MSSNKNSKTGAKSGSEVVKQEDVIVAVLIADSFSIRFAPVTDCKPKVFFKILFLVQRLNFFKLYARHFFPWSTGQ